MSSKSRPLEERSITYRGYENPETLVEMLLETRSLEAVCAAAESRIKDIQFLILEKKLLGENNEP